MVEQLFLWVLATPLGMLAQGQCWWEMLLTEFILLLDKGLTWGSVTWHPWLRWWRECWWTVEALGTMNTSASMRLRDRDTTSSPWPVWTPCRSCTALTTFPWCWPDHWGLWRQMRLNQLKIL